MASFTVLTKEAPFRMVLVREGFTSSAFLLGPLWFAWHRSWLGLTAWLSGAALIVAVSTAFSISGGFLFASLLAFMFLMALEACEFRRRSFIRRGYRQADLVQARNRNEAEVRFLARHLSGAGITNPSGPSPRLAPYRAETVGLFLNGT